MLDLFNPCISLVENTISKTAFLNLNVFKKEVNFFLWQGEDRFFSLGEGLSEFLFLKALLAIIFLQKKVYFYFICPPQIINGRLLRYQHTVARSKVPCGNFCTIYKKINKALLKFQHYCEDNKSTYSGFGLLWCFRILWYFT